MSQAPDNIDWTLTTWEGSRREQLRRWRTLTLRERLQALEDMTELTEHFRRMRETGKFSAAPSGKTAAPASEAHAIRQNPAQYDSNDGRHEATPSGGVAEPPGHAPRKPQTPEPSQTPPDERKR